VFRELDLANLTPQPSTEQPLAIRGNHGRKPPPPRQRQPGERLFEFLRGHDRFLCELRDDGEHGVDVQFFVNEEFRFSRRLPNRALAIAFAQAHRQNIERGWVDG
jgi:hypothetical protein